MKNYNSKNIRDLREDHDITQAEVAKVLGIAQNTYSQYETGKIQFTARNAGYVSRFLRYQCGLSFGSDRKPKAKIKNQYEKGIKSDAFLYTLKLYLNSIQLPDHF